MIFKIGKQCEAHIMTVMEKMVSGIPFGMFLADDSKGFADNFQDLTDLYKKFNKS